MLKSIVCLGDEDRALTHFAEAEALYMAGRVGGQLSDGTVIDISDGVAYVHSPFLAEYIILAPRDAGLGDSSYFLDLYGYNHRKDAMIPEGRMNVIADYSVNGYPNNIGPEAIYISDGVMAYASLSVTTDAKPLRDPESYVIDFGFMGATEDLQTNETAFTVQGFAGCHIGFEGTASFFSQGPYLFCANAYGVDRTGSAPVYRALFGVNYQAAQSMIVDTYNSGNSDVQYKLVSVGFLYASVGRDSAFDYALYELAVGVMRYDDPGGMISSQFPVVVPLGNNRAVTLYKKRNANAAYLFGGSFAIGSTKISGTGFSQVALATTGVTGGWFYQTEWNHGTSASTTLTTTSDDVKFNYLMETLTHAASFVVPLSQDETLIVGKKVYVGYTEGTADWSNATLLGSAQLMCYSVTDTGFAEQGTVALYFDDFYDGTHPVAGGAVTLYRHDVVGMLGLGLSGTDRKVVVFAHRYSATYTGSPPTFAYDGLYRFYSDDSGATWGAGTQVTLDWGVDGAPPSWRFAPPKIAGFTAGGEAIVLLGVTFGTPVTGGTELTDSTMFSSSDSGLTFELSPTGTVDLSYVLPTGSSIFQPGRGMTSVQDFGNHEDGYAPSPYRHMPTYYGTPTAACRDSAADPNL